jgi:hypothetical protein
MSQDPSTSGDENPGVVSYLFGPRLTSHACIFPLFFTVFLFTSCSLLTGFDDSFLTLIYLLCFSLSFPSHL